MIFDALTPNLINLTEKVGEMIMSHYKTSLSVETKADETPITIVDQKAHELITSALATLTPDVPILSEESEQIDFETRSSWDEYWLIDPLDGTRDFIEQTGEFCICIAYIKNNRPIFGLIYAPLSKTHYFTNDQMQAFKLQNNQTSLLKTTDNKQPLEIVIGHHSFENQQLQSYLKTFGDTRISRLGSALKFCKIAEGEFNHYPRFGPCSEWDTAAGGCILEAAGGCVVDEDDKPLRYNTKDSLISPIFFASGKA
ncbi:3'(2'),5'-bisphosphate nucleotidase [uncultured Candidatus Thioglobus sp.]|nr:3'(2'),5'-bisphosphate nucleotidase [uncultured Candidatus Thioglobus sp.]